MAAAEGGAGGRTLWRRFPWDPRAATGEPFSREYIPPASGRGRFDLPNQDGGVLYLAETREHAVGEWLGRFRTAGVEQADLLHGGHTQALVRVELTVPPGRIADLCDPELLARFRLPPDRLAVRDRRLTHPVAATLRAAGFWGLRWWSAFGGEWHTVALFLDTLPPGVLVWQRPVPLDLSHPALLAAAEWLAVPVRAS